MADVNKNQKDTNEQSIYYRKANVGRLLSYFIPHIPLIILAVVIAFLINAAVLLRPDILHRIIDDYLIPGNFDESAVNALGIFFFVLISGGALLNYLQHVLLNYVGQSIMHRLRTDLFNKIQRMGMPFFDRFSSGRLLRRTYFP